MRVNSLFAILFAIVCIMLISNDAFAHCDTIDGPVVKDARIALEAGNIFPVLKWISKNDEAAITKAFESTLQVRALSDDAKEMADTYFFETLVRIHREGEGFPYTGLKPAGAVEPPIAAADNALEDKNVQGLAKKISNAVMQKIEELFKEVIETEKRKDENVEAGRRYVEAYVGYTHFIEGIHTMVSEGAHHGPEE